MSKLIFDQSTSLDGFTTGPNPRSEEPNGDDGMRLVEWAFEQDAETQAVLEEVHANTGAMICGRNTYDVSLPFWGANGPSGDRRVPMVVLTHEVPSEFPETSVYSFATGGIEAALEEAKGRAEGGDNIAIVGGADVAGQYLQAGLLDELLLHVVPVLFGRGTPLFDAEGEHIGLETFDVIRGDGATHMRLRVSANG